MQQSIHFTGQLVSDRVSSRGGEGWWKSAMGKGRVGEGGGSEGGRGRGGELSASVLSMANWGVLSMHTSTEVWGHVPQKISKI